MPNILDIYNDRSMGGLVNILRQQPQHYDTLRNLPIDYNELGALPSSAYAYPEQRAYPIHNRQMALLSALYNAHYPPQEQLPPNVYENFKKASYLYEFDLPEQKVEKSASEILLDDADFLLPGLKRFPVRDRKEADFAQSLLVKNAHLMGYDHLAEACTNLVTKYASFGATTDEIAPVIYKYAGLTLSNRDVLEASVNRRLDFCKTAEEKVPYEKLAELLYQIDFNRHNLLKVASSLEKLDKQANLRHLYDKHLPNPIESVFNTDKIYIPEREKQASAGAFSAEHAENVTPEQIKSLLGDEVLSEASDHGELDKEKLIHIVNSLPHDMVTDFVDRIGG